MTRFLLCSASLLAVIASTPAHAQSEDEIVVTGQRAQQQRSIEEKRDALGIMDVAAADEIGQLPDRNVAEVIERLPGVGVQYDQGEGRYVAVRGVPSALNGYTINGFEVGNPDGLDRRLPLDILSGQLLNRVEVSKVKTADMMGQGIGANINLVTQTAFDFDDPFTLNANAQVGYQQLRKEDQPIRGDVTVGGRFGADEQFGILLGGSYSDRTYTSYGLYPDDWAPDARFARGAIPINTKYTDYRLKRERIGASGSLDWRSGATELYIRGVYSKFTEDEYRQRFRLDFSNPTVIAADGTSATFGTSEQRSDLRLEYKEKSVLSGMAGGSTEFADGKWKLDFGAARTHNEVIEPNQLWQFRSVPTPGPVAVDFSDKIFTAVPVNGYPTPAQMQFRQYSEQDESGDENIWQFRADLTGKLMNDESFIKVGANARMTDKSFDSHNDIYDRGNAANRFTLVGLAGEDVLSFPKKGVGMLVSPTIDEDLIRAFTEGKLDTLQFVRNTATSLANENLNDFSIDENVYAGFAMANLDFGAFAVTAGVRAERTELDITGFQLVGGTTVVPATGGRNYTNILPSIVLRAQPQDDVILRAAYSRSIGRPNYADLTPGGTVSVIDESASIGNPALKPYQSENLDVAAEWYFAPGGMLSLGVFAKFIKDPIFTETVTLTDVEFAGNQFDTLSLSQKQNADKADLIGLEAAYQQQFTFLPGFLSGFGVNLNLTVIDSSLRVPGRENTGFPEQSKLLWGAQLFYQKGPVEASVAYHHTGRALIAVDSDPETDQFNDDLRRLDAKVSFDLMRNIRVFFEGQNLTDEPTRQYQGGHRDWVIQNERYGRTFYAGASFRW